MKARIAIIGGTALAAILTGGWLLWPKSLMTQFRSAGIDVKEGVVVFNLGMKDYWYGTTLNNEPKIVEIVQRSGYDDVTSTIGYKENGTRFFARGNRNTDGKAYRTISITRKKDYLQIITNAEL